MDIHRCRFVDYTPSAINALAFSHTSGKRSRDQPIRLAIGRANGDIEIWDPRKGLWIHETTLYGGQGRSVDGLAWIQDPDEVDGTGFVMRGKMRLFSIGYSSSIVEWDLVTGLPLQESTGSHSEIWCFAAQPTTDAVRAEKGQANGKPKTDTARQDLVAGCADGSLVLFSTADGGLEYVRTFPRVGKKKARVLSVTFQSRDVVVAGFSDSSIRVFNIRKGTVLRDIAVGGGVKGGPKETLVWAVECLKDGTIVAGDSNGELSFWDAKNYSHLQRIKSHEADILCLASSPDGQTVLSGGMDRRTCIYNLSSVSSAKRRWIKTTHKRFHRHDVKAMACFENSKLSVVVSGGLDTAPVLIPLRQFDTEYSRQLPFVPQQSPVTGSHRFVVNWTGNEVKIWTVGSRSSALAGRLDAADSTNFKLAAQISLKDDENITSASIDPSGRLLVVATVAKIKLFQLQSASSHAQPSTISIRKLEVPACIDTEGARTAQISPDGHWLLLVGCSGKVKLGRIVADQDAEPTVLPQLVSLHRPVRTDEKKIQNGLNGSWGSYDRLVVRSSFSADGRILAIGDLGGRIDSWVLEGHYDSTAPPVDHLSAQQGVTNGDADDDEGIDGEPSSGESRLVFYGQHWIQNPNGLLIPRLPSTPLILSFRPDASSTDGDSHRSLNKTPNGNPAVHPTRHNPHAHSHSLPTNPPCEDKLFVMTATHALFEFSMLSGRMTPWSRTSSTTIMPEQFKLQRDRAVGCLWDVARERIWVHSATWLAMFDLRHDSAEFDEDESRLDQNATNGVVAARKRRRSSLADAPSSAFFEQRTKKQLKYKKGASGLAGSARRPDELSASLAGRKIRKLKADGTSEVVVDKAQAKAKSGTRDEQNSDAEDNHEDDDSDDPSDDSEAVADAEAKALVKVKRPHHGSAGDEGADGHDEDDDNLDDSQHAKRSSPPFYMTLRYRQILGLVLLTSLDAADTSSQVSAEDDDASDTSDDGPVLEVALVERPFAELDLGPRFVGRPGET